MKRIFSCRTVKPLRAWIYKVDIRRVRNVKQQLVAKSVGFFKKNGKFYPTTDGLSNLSFEMEKRMERREQLMAANKKKSAERMKKELEAQKSRAEASGLKIFMAYAHKRLIAML